MHVLSEFGIEILFNVSVTMVVKAHMDSFASVRMKSHSLKHYKA